MDVMPMLQEPKIMYYREVAERKRPLAGEHIKFALIEDPSSDTKPVRGLKNTGVSIICTAGAVL